MILSLCLLVLAAWLALFKIKRRRLYQLASAIPGPDDELPVIGIAHRLGGNTEDIMKSLQHYSYQSMKHDGLLRGWLGHILYFFLVNPMDAEMVLKTCLEKDDLHRFPRKIIGNGGIFAPVPIWRKRRKILIPAFSPKIVETFVEVFSQQSEKLNKLLQNLNHVGQFSIWPFLSSYSLDAVCETAMGVKINAQGNPASPFMMSISRLLNLVCERIFHLWLQPDWLYSLFPQSTEHEKCLRILHDFTDKVIKKKRQELEIEKKNRADNVDHDGLEGYKRKSFLDLLISLSGGEKGYTNVELREEVLTLTVAGMDTSAVITGYTLMLMAKYPAVQEKVYEELSQVFDDDIDRPLVKEDLTKLKYLERVVKEALRLYPPVPFIIRKVQEEIKLPSGRVLPAGCGVAVSIWGAHRDPRYWGDDAENFDPDRFLPERFNLAHACSYMPFSNGPRNCIGYQYALLSVKTVLASVLRRFKVAGEKETSPAPHIRVKLDIMMKAVDGYQVALVRRNIKRANGCTVPNGCIANGHKIANGHGITNGNINNTSSQCL